MPVSPAPTCPLTAFKRSDRLCRRDTQDSRIPSCEMHPRSGRIWRRGNSRKPKVDSATGRLRSGTEVSRPSLLPPLNNSKANQHRADDRDRAGQSPQPMRAEADVVKQLQRRANWLSCRVLHCCSVDLVVRKVRLSPGSDRIADHSADPGCATSGPQRLLRKPTWASALTA